MPITKSPLAFEDCRELMAKALETERGLRVRCASVTLARRLRARMFTLRSMDRIANRDVYPEGSLLHDNSEFDKLVLSIPVAEDGKTPLPEIHIVKRSITHYQTEEL